MIKNFFMMAIFALPFFASAQSLKLGVVDVDSLISSMPETSAAQNTLSELQKKYVAEFNKLEEEFQSQYEEFNKMSDNDPQDVKENKAKQLMALQETLNSFQKNAMEELQKQQDDLMAPISQKVHKAIESVGKETGFSYIQNIKESFFFASPVEDITPLVKKKLGL